MGDLQVDSTRLRDTGTALRLLAGELRDAERIVADYERAIGSRGLAHQLDRMQGTWDDRRNDLRDAIEGLGEVAREAGEAYDDIEQHLVAAMEGS